MAEENPLENELDQPIDDQENFDLDDLESAEPDVVDNQDESSQAGTSGGRFANVINSIKTNRRISFNWRHQSIFIIIVSFSIATPDKKQAVNPGMTQAEAPISAAKKL